MNISNISASTNPCQAQLRDGFKQRSQDFDALKSALQSGDLTSAQKAFATFQQDIQSARQARGNSQNTQPAQSGKSQTGNDFQAVEDALKTGDLTGAQKAFAALQQDIQSARQARGGHVHHHHHDDNDGDAAQAASAGSTATTAAQPIGSTLNVLG